MYPHTYQQRPNLSETNLSMPSKDTDDPPGPLSGQKNFFTADQMAAGIKKFVNRYEINSAFAAKLQSLMGYEIVLICDDSGSMNTELHDTPGSYQPSPTRWDELKRTISIVVDLASVLDPDGVDIYFLNRAPLRNVRSSKELNHVFGILPEGMTPIVRVLRQVLQEKRQQIQERKLLVLIATDGEPTDDEGYPTIEEFRHVLQHERRPIERIPVTILACTGDDYSMEYLNNWDKTIERLDVVGDYKSEKSQIVKCQGSSFPFGYGDYVIKILMGGIDDWFDQLDEKKVSLDGYGRPTAASSIVSSPVLSPVSSSIPSSVLSTVTSSVPLIVPPTTSSTTPMRPGLNPYNSLN